MSDRVLFISGRCEHCKKILIGIMVLLILKAIYPTNENFANMGYIFEINDNYKLRRVNKDILIIDNFYKHPERVLRYAVTNRHNFFTHKIIILIYLMK